jgi:ParB-like chromosome segregation protein Spo0J
MSKRTESIEWVALGDIVLGTNARTIRPAKDRINEYARSIAMYGILVPLIAEKHADGYHLQAGYTRMAALAQLKADKALTALAQLNGVDLDRVPVRLYTGDEKGRLMLPIIENNFHDVMNEVDVATQVRSLLDAGQEVQQLEEFFGKPKFALLLSVLALPTEVQELIKADRIKASTAVKFAKEIPEPAKLLKALNKASDKVEQLYKSGKRRIARAAFSPAIEAARRYARCGRAFSLHEPGCSTPFVLHGGAVRDGVCLKERPHAAWDPGSSRPFLHAAGAVGRFTACPVQRLGAVFDGGRCPFSRNRPLAQGDCRRALSGPMGHGQARRVG